MPNPIIRREGHGDGTAIDVVVEAAFGHRTEADLVAALRQSGDSVLSLIAEDACDIVGHILFSRLRQPEDCLALAPVCVSPGRQRQGIGSMLVRQGLVHAARDGWQAVFVLGEPAFYERFGFSLSAAAKFASEYPRSHFMVRELAPASLRNRGGDVLYPEPFLALS